MKKVEQVLKRIRLARIEKGYSQNYIGKQLCMSQYAYHKLENGHAKLKVKTLLDIADVLEVEAIYLLIG